MWQYPSIVGRRAAMARAKQPKQIHQLTLPQFEAMFPHEDACKAYLQARRWPEGVRCPRVFVRWQGLKWRNPASGEIETAPRLTPADLPRELAAVARWHNLAVEPDSDHARTLAKGRGPSWQKPLAEAPGLADLDVLAAQDAAEQDATATVGAVA